MFISIIVPTLNEEDHLSTLLDFFSEHPQKEQFEVIVADGGSTDATVPIAHRYGVKVISSNEASRAKQMNEGSKKADGDVLYFVHADTMPVRSFVEDIRNTLDLGYDSGCYRFKFNNPKNPLLHINGFFTRFPFLWCRGGDQTLFVRRNVFERLGRYNERYTIMEDYELIERLKAHGVPFKIISKSVKVSPRKYDHNSYLRVQMAKWKAMKMYRKGTDPKEIRQFYYQYLTVKDRSS